MRPDWQVLEGLIPGIRSDGVNGGAWAAGLALLRLQTLFATLPMNISGINYMNAWS